MKHKIPQIMLQLSQSIQMEHRNQAATPKSHSGPVWGNIRKGEIILTLFKNQNARAPSPKYLKWFAILVLWRSVKQVRVRLFTLYIYFVELTQNYWYFVTKIVLTYCEKKLFYWSRKTFEIWGWRPRICKLFEITWTIYSNSERPEQFLVTECFFNLFLEVSQI